VRGKARRLLSPETTLGSAIRAGPCVTLPQAENRLPSQGHSKAGPVDEMGPREAPAQSRGLSSGDEQVSPAPQSATVKQACVHIALNAERPFASRTTRGGRPAPSLRWSQEGASSAVAASVGDASVPLSVPLVLRSPLVAPLDSIDA